MTKTEKTVLFKALICLLNTSAMDCLDKPSRDIKMAKAEYIKSTIKMINEMLELEALTEEEEIYLIKREDLRFAPNLSR